MIRTARQKELSRNTPLWPANYRLGMWAFLLQRVTGLALVGYLFVHIWVISYSVVSSGSFDGAMRFLQMPVFIAADVLLLAAVLTHGLNGIRILLFDAGIGVRRQKTLFWGFMALAAVVSAWAVYQVWPFLFGQSLV